MDKRFRNKFGDKNFTKLTNHIDNNFLSICTILDEIAVKGSENYDVIRLQVALLTIGLFGRSVKQINL